MTGERRGQPCPNEELAVGWAMHALEPNEEALLRDHLPGCARCQLTVRSTHEVMAVMGGSVRREEPPPRLRARLMNAIEHTPQEPQKPNQPRHALPDAAPIPLRPRRSRARVLLAAAAVLLVVAMGGAAAVKLNQLSGEVSAVKLQNEQMNRALALSVDPKASHVPLTSTTSGEEIGTLVSTASDAAFVPERLSPNDSGHIYVVWGTSTSPPVPLATFDLQAGAPNLLTWSADAHKHNKFAVSIEPGRVAPAKPSTIVADGQVA